MSSFCTVLHPPEHARLGYQQPVSYIGLLKFWIFNLIQRIAKSQFCAYQKADKQKLVCSSILTAVRHRRLSSSPLGRKRLHSSRTWDQQSWNSHSPRRTADWRCQATPYPTIRCFILWSFRCYWIWWLLAWICESSINQVRICTPKLQFKKINVDGWPSLELKLNGVIFQSYKWDQNPNKNSIAYTFKHSKSNHVI